MPGGGLVAKRLPPHAVATGMLVLCAAALAYWPLLGALAERMWQTEHYSHFPLILVGTAFLAGRAIQSISVRQRPTAWVVGILWVFACGICSLAVVAESPWTAGVSAMFTLLAISYSAGGRIFLKAVFPAWIFLWLAVPLPLGKDVEVLQGLQVLATHAASGILDWFDCPHLVSGVTLKFPGSEPFLIEEACSGIRSLYATLTCTLFFCLFVRRGIGRTLALMVVAVWWVFVANTARVVVVCGVSSQTSVSLAEGLVHDFIGMMVFATSLLLIYSSDRMLLYLVPPHVDSAGEFADDAEADLPEATESQPPGPQLIGSIALTAFFSAAFAWQLVMSEPAPSYKTASMIRLEENALPAKFGNWTRVAFRHVGRESDDPNGQLSQHWVYQSGSRKVRVSVDGPFRGWHHLAACFQGQGWQVIAARNIRVDEELPAVELVLSRGPARFGYAIWACFDEKSAVINPPGSRTSLRALDRLKSLLGNEKDFSRPSYQIHLFFESGTRVDKDKPAVELFRKCVDQIRSSSPPIEVQR